MPCKVAISIINYRTGKLTLNCVRSALEALEGADGQVVVVDNASGDGSAEEIAAWMDGCPPDTPVRLVRSDRNTGFSGGHNLAIQTVQAEHYLLLNSDAVLRPSFFRHLLATADDNPDAGLIAPQIETEDGRIQVSCFRFHSLHSEFIRGAGSGPVTRVLKNHVVALDPPVDPAQIEWASFACILLRKAMIDRIGPMDEGYFLYFEDAEYGLRARRAGWRVLQEPRAVAVHFRGGSGPVKTLEKERRRLPAYYYASRTRFFYHRYGRFGPVAANLAWLAGRGVTQLRRLLGKSVAPTIEVEPRDIWINALHPTGSRHAPEDAA